MIILYNPQSTPSHKKPLPMSLLAVASMLEGEHEYEIVDGNLIADPAAHIIELSKTKKLDAIAFTVMPGPQLNRAVPDAKRIKAALPDVPIVWGGYFASQHDDVILKENYVDFCVHSQGEQTFLELVRVLKHGGDLSAIAGITYKKQNSKLPTPNSQSEIFNLQPRLAQGERSSIIHNPHRPLIPLDQLPDWPYHKIPMERYFHKHYLGNRVGTHHSSYGCPFACNFCAVVGMVNKRWLPQSPERMARILKFQHDEYGADAMQFHDMDFFVSEARTAEFAERITPLGMTWWALGRVDELMRYSDATWQQMKASGLKMVFCGAESGSDEVLKRMNKGGKVSANATLELAKRMQSYNIVPEYSFVMGNPPDPVADIRQTTEFIRKVKAVNPATEIIMYIYTPVPQEGTLYEEAKAFGFKFPDTLDGWVSGDWREFALRRDPHNPWLNHETQQMVRDFERVLNAYYPTTTDIKLRGVRRAALRAISSWRYHTRFYHFPIELRAYHKLVAYQRPETTGF